MGIESAEGKGGGAVIKRHEIFDVQRGIFGKRRNPAGTFVGVEVAFGDEGVGAAEPVGDNEEDEGVLRARARCEVDVNRT